MRLQKVTKLVEKIVTQGVKKLKYVTPSCRVGTAEELGLKLKNIEGDTLKLSLPKFELSEALEQRLSNNVSKQRFLSSYQEFFKSRKIATNYGNEAIIKQGDMLHGMTYQPEALESILKDGIVSGDIAFVGKNVQSDEAFLKNGFRIICEDGETFGCADFYTSPKTMTIEEYFLYAFREIKPFKRAPEASRLPNKTKKRSIAFVVDSQKFKDICPTLSHNSATPSNLGSSPLNDIIHHFPNGENLKSVLVGVPSNCISKIVVGAGLKPEEIKHIKTLIQKMNLDINIYDISGNIL